jgi:hypothetical protein
MRDSVPLNTIKEQSAVEIRQEWDKCLTIRGYESALMPNRKQRDVAKHHNIKANDR